MGIHNYKKRLEGAREILAKATIREEDKALIAALYDGGFRIGELGGLRIKDVGFDHYVWCESNRVWQDRDAEIEMGIWD